MNKEQFIAQFTANFCAAWCAQNYVDYCMRGKHEELANPPMEDAIFLANSAWELYEKHNKLDSN